MTIWDYANNHSGDLTIMVIALAICLYGAVEAISQRWRQ